MNFSYSLVHKLVVVSIQQGANSLQASMGKLIIPRRNRSHNKLIV